MILNFFFKISIIKLTVKITKKYLLFHNKNWNIVINFKDVYKNISCLFSTSYIYGCISEYPLDIKNNNSIVYKLKKCHIFHHSTYYKISFYIFKTKKFKSFSLLMKKNLNIFFVITHFYILHFYVSFYITLHLHSTFLYFYQKIDNTIQIYNCVYRRFVNYRLLKSNYRYIISKLLLYTLLTHVSRCQYSICNKSLQYMFTCTTDICMYILCTILLLILYVLLTYASRCQYPICNKPLQYMSICTIDIFIHTLSYIEIITRRRTNQINFCCKLNKHSLCIRVLPKHKINLTEKISHNSRYVLKLSKNTLTQIMCIITYSFTSRIIYTYFITPK